MGAIFKSGEARIPEGMVAGYLHNIISRDRDSRRSEDDMYRGDFGSSSVRNRLKKVYDLKTNTPAFISKRHADFLNSDDGFEKYVIDWAVVGVLGYVAYTPKVVLPTGLKGPLYISGLGGRGFKNVTELRSAVRNSPSKNMIGKDIYIRGGMGLAVVGRVDMDYHVYKTKPSKRPDKYTWLERYVEIAYGDTTPTKITSTQCTLSTRFTY